MQDLETKRSKYKGQLMDVKTNKEYTAMLHEIEGVERDIKAREDVILEEMEKAEGLAASVKREEADFKVVEAESKKAQAETRRRDGAAAGERRAAARRVAPASPPRCRRTLASSTRASRSSAARASRRRATGCARPATCGCGSRSGSRSARTSELFQCESCSRIYFYEPPPPTVVAEP